MFTGYNFLTWNNRQQTIAGTSCFEGLWQTQRTQPLFLHPCDRYAFQEGEVLGLIVNLMSTQSCILSEQRMSNMTGYIPSKFLSPSKKTDKLAHGKSVWSGCWGREPYIEVLALTFHQRRHLSLSYKPLIIHFDVIRNIA